MDFDNYTLGELILLAALGVVAFVCFCTTSTIALFKFYRQLQVTLKHRCGFRGRDAIPMYWENMHKDIKKALTRDDPDFFDDHYPLDEESVALLQRLMHSTCGDKKKHFRIVRAVRIENSAMWAAYQTEAAKIARRRGECQYAGKGEPSTLHALPSEGYSRIADELDPDICEAMMWHAASPGAALQISHDGFKIQHGAPTHGNRFGTGGYFCEQSDKADTYAGHGEGIYKDCYAMLLCRVVLGKQYHTTAFRQEDASQQAMGIFGAHDSTLAEPMGSSVREFVVFEDAQVYPEYVIVYERAPSQPIGLPNLRTDNDLDSVMPPSEKYPGYWFCRNNKNPNFHETFPDEEMLPIAQSVFDSTWHNSATADRDGPMPQRLHVVKVTRLESSRLWTTYTDKQDALHEAYRHQSLPGSHVQSTAQLPRNLRRWLRADVNEVFLLEGISPKIAVKLMEGNYEGLQPDRECVFGKGAYLAESSSKADELSQDDHEGYYEGLYAMLLSRVTLGVVLDVTAEDPSAHERVGADHDYDSIVGTRSGTDGSSYSQIVVPDRSLIYPEYVILYERIDEEENSDDDDEDDLLP